MGDGYGEETRNGTLLSTTTRQPHRITPPRHAPTFDLGGRVHLQTMIDRTGRARRAASGKERAGMAGGGCECGVGLAYRKNVQWEGGRPLAARCRRVMLLVASGEGGPGEHGAARLFSSPSYSAQHRPSLRWNLEFSTRSPPGKIRRLCSSRRSVPPSC